MKNALILHGTDADHTSHWFGWLSAELEKEGYKTWVPDLPGADLPSIRHYNDFLLGSDWVFDKDSIIVGHSSGAVEILGLLNDDRFKATVNICFLVGVFEGDLGWEKLRELKVRLDYDVIKMKAGRFVVIHSDNDPHCPIDGAKRIGERLDGEFVMIPGQGHFSTSTDPSYTKFPKLLDLIRERS